VGANPSGSAGSCCGVCRCCSAPWRPDRSAACSHGGARCSRTRASCEWHCTPRGTTGSSSLERLRSQTTSSGPSRHPQL
jgi:hypothetical protein